MESESSKVAQARSLYSTLEERYKDVLADYEGLLLQAGDPTLLSFESPFRELRNWLKNVTSSLISWGDDIRADIGSLRALEDTSLGVHVQNILGNLGEQLSKTGLASSFEDVEKLREISLLLLRPSASDGDSQEDPLLIISRQLALLQDLVQPIRMLHAINEHKGPYGGIKQKVDEIYKQHVPDYETSTAARGIVGDLSGLLKTDTLRVMGNIAKPASEDSPQYEKLGTGAPEWRFTKQAETLDQALRKFGIRQKVWLLAEDHPDRLTSQRPLAEAYLADGQVQEAVALLEYVTKIQEVTLAEDHPDLLASQHALVRAYRANNQRDNAVMLPEQGMKVEAARPDDRPGELGLLKARQEAYRSNERVDEAAGLRPAARRAASIGGDDASSTSRDEGRAAALQPTAPRSNRAPGLAVALGQLPRHAHVGDIIPEVTVLLTHVGPDAVRPAPSSYILYVTDVTGVELGPEASPIPPRFVMGKAERCPISDRELVRFGPFRFHSTGIFRFGVSAYTIANDRRVDLASSLIGLSYDRLVVTART